MSYIKLFIDVSKKQNKSQNLKISPELDKAIKKIFKEPIEKLFDKPEIIENNFYQFLKYSGDYYNELLAKGIKPDTEEISEVIDLVVKTDKNNQIEYYKNLFLLEFLENKIHIIE